MKLLLIVFFGLALIGCTKYPKPEPAPEDPDAIVSSGNIQTDINGGMSIEDILTFVPVDSLYGLMYKGGLIFYVNESNYTGLVASLTDQSTGTTWGCDGTLITGANGVAAGTGEQNTLDILAECTTPGIAADICASYDNGTYSDWFLPSKDELNAMYWNIGPGAPDPITNIGNFTETHYWTSSELGSSTTAYGQYFGSGTTQFVQNKSLSLYVRAVRAF